MCVSDCDTLPKNHVAEWFFEAVRTCLLPVRTGWFFEAITSKDSMRGELLTFSYHVHTDEEIKCYIHWVCISLGLCASRSTPI